MQAITSILLQVPAHTADAINRLATMSGRHRHEQASLLLQLAVLRELRAERQFAAIDAAISKAEQP